MEADGAGSLAEGFVGAAAEEPGEEEAVAAAEPTDRRMTNCECGGRGMTRSSTAPTAAPALRGLVL